MVGIHKAKKSGRRRVKGQRLFKRQLQKSTLEMSVAWTRVEVVERGRIQTQKGLRGTSLVVQWLRIPFQFRRHGFDPWSGN